MRLAAALCLLLVPAAANAGDASPGVDIVAKLYHDYAWEAVLSEPDDAYVPLVHEPRATLERYFDPVLADLIAKDAECAARTQEICRLDFSPLWASQDPGAIGLDVTASNEPTIVIVRFDYPGEPASIELKYTVAEGPSGWRITNIAGADWNLLEILRDAP